MAATGRQLHNLPPPNKIPEGFELVTELNKILEEEEERRIQGKPASNRGT